MKVPIITTTFWTIKILSTTVIFGGGFVEVGRW